VKGRQEVPGRYVIASAETAEFLEFVKEVLDQVPGFVQSPIIHSLSGPIAPQQNDGLFATLC
jgi:hypothetical protein